MMGRGAFGGACCAVVWEGAYAVGGIAIREGWKLGTFGEGGDSWRTDVVGDMDGDARPGDGEVE